MELCRIHFWLKKKKKGILKLIFSSFIWPTFNSYLLQLNDFTRQDIIASFSDIDLFFSFVVFRVNVFSSSASDVGQCRNVCRDLRYFRPVWFLHSCNLDPDHPGSGMWARVRRWVCVKVPRWPTWEEFHWSKVIFKHFEISWLCTDLQSLSEGCHRCTQRSVRRFNYCFEFKSTLIYDKKSLVHKINRL